MKAVNKKRSAASQPITSAYVGLHVGEVFYGNIGSEDQSSISPWWGRGQRVNRIASMCRSVDRTALVSSNFRYQTARCGRPPLPGLDRTLRCNVSRARISTPSIRMWPPTKR